MELISFRSAFKTSVPGPCDPNRGSSKLTSNKGWIKMTLNLSILESKTEAHWKVLKQNDNSMKLFAVSHSKNL